MSDLATELSRLGGGGGRGRALATARYWPAACCGLSLPGALLGHPLGIVVLVESLALVGAAAWADRRLAAS